MVFKKIKYNILIVFLIFVISAAVICPALTFSLGNADVGEIPPAIPETPDIGQGGGNDEDTTKPIYRFTSALAAYNQGKKNLQDQNEYYSKITIVANFLDLKYVFSADRIKNFTTEQNQFYITGGNVTSTPLPVQMKIGFDQNKEKLNWMADFSLFGNPSKKLAYKTKSEEFKNKYALLPTSDEFILYQKSTVNSSSCVRYSNYHKAIMALNDSSLDSFLPFFKGALKELPYSVSVSDIKSIVYVSNNGDLISTNATFKISLKLYGILFNGSVSVGESFYSTDKAPVLTLPSDFESVYDSQNPKK